MVQPPPPKTVWPLLMKSDGRLPCGPAVPALRADPGDVSARNRCVPNHPKWEAFQLPSTSRWHISTIWGRRGGKLPVDTMTHESQNGSPERKKADRKMECVIPFIGSSSADRMNAWWERKSGARLPLAGGDGG